MEMVNDATGFRLELDFALLSSAFMLAKRASPSELPKEISSTSSEANPSKLSEGC